MDIYGKSKSKLKKVYENSSDKNIKFQEMEGGFGFEVSLAKQTFKDGEMNYGFQSAGVKLFVDRRELKRFYEDLKKEMADIAKRTIERLSQKRDKGYDDHIKFLKQYVSWSPER